MQEVIVAGIDAIKSEPQTYHIHLPFREMLYAGTVAHVSEDMMREGSLQSIGTEEITTVLLGGEGIEAVVVASHKVGEDRTRYECGLGAQAADKSRHVLLWIEAQAVHAGVQFYVYGHGCYSGTLGSMDESIKETETIHLRFQIVLEEGVETGHLGIHHHDVLRYAVGAKQGSLVGNGNGQITHLFLTLQGLRHLHGTCTIGIGLDHADDARLGIEEGAVIVEVLHHGPEVYLQYGFVHLLFKGFGDGIEVEGACSLDKHNAVAQVKELLTMHKLLGGREEGASCIQTGKARGTSLYLCTYGHEAFKSAALHQTGNVRVKFVRWLTALQYIAENEYALAACPVGTAVHEVQGNVQAAEVAVIGIVDERTSVSALLYLQSHGHGFKPLQTFADDLLAHAQMTADTGTEIAVALQCVGLVPCLEHHGAVLEQEHFFMPFLLHALEVLLMGRSQACEHAYGGLDDALQRLHLVWTAYACLKNAYLRVVIEPPDTQRHAYLRIVTAWRTGHGHIRRKHLVEPLLDHSLAVAARYAYNRDVVGLAVPLGQPL